MEKDWRTKNGKKVAPIGHAAIMAESANGSNLSRFRCKKSRNNTSGIKGVSFDKARGKWMAQKRYGGKKVLSKRFDSKEEAEKAYLEANEKYYKLTLEAIKRAE